MKRNFFRLLLSAVLLMCSAAAGAVGTQPSGAGTSDNPYQIATKNNLLWFADHVNHGNLTACAILTADITVNTGVLDSDGNLNSGTFETWTPIGNWGDGSVYKGFAGEFNGGGHTISGLYFNDEKKEPVGLFGMADNNGYIHDVGVKDSYFRGKSHVAGICGDLAKGKIENCWNGATVIGASGCAGGITGSCWYSSSVSGCHNIGKISPINSNVCGGICGSVTKNVDDKKIYVSNCVSLEGKCDRAYNLSNGTDTCIISNVSIQKASAFESGEVCWKLNGKKIDTKWRQQIGTDSYPVWTGNLLVNHSDEKGYYNETMCEASANHIHCFSTMLVPRCDNSVITYWHCSKCSKDFTDADRTKEETVAHKSGHFPDYHMEIMPTETSVGNYGYYRCTNCNAMFKDELCSVLTNMDEMTIPYAKTSEIWYTSTDKETVQPYPNAFGATITGNKYDCGLGVITFDKELTGIGMLAFSQCRSLQSINIPSSATTIGNAAFNNCSLLQSINIPSSATTIGKRAFNNCSSLPSINIPSAVTCIGEDAFNGCTSLQEINIPSDSKLEIISGTAFANCPNLTSITFPPHLKEIEASAFDNCSSLKSITFKSLPEISSNAFGPSYKQIISPIDLYDSDKPYIGTSLDNYPSQLFRLRYHRTLEPGKWGTIVLPFALYSGYGGLAFYELKEMTIGDESGSLTFTRVDEPEAGVPYLFRNETDSEYEFTLEGRSPDARDIILTPKDQTAGAFKMKGSFKQTSLNTTDKPNDNLYYLKEGGFYHANGKINIAPFRAYIEGHGASPVQSFMLMVNDGGVTAVPGILDGDGTLDETEAIYDLSGHRLDAPVEGQVNIIRLKSGKTVKQMF